MFNQIEHMIARAEYQHMQHASANCVEGTEVASKPGLVRRLLSALTSRKPDEIDQALTHTNYQRNVLSTEH